MEACHLFRASLTRWADGIFWVELGVSEMMRVAPFCESLVFRHRDKKVRQRRRAWGDQAKGRARSATTTGPFAAESEDHGWHAACLVWDVRLGFDVPKSRGIMFTAERRRERETKIETKRERAGPVLNQ